MILLQPNMGESILLKTKNQTPRSVYRQCVFPRAFAFEGMKISAGNIRDIIQTLGGIQQIQFHQDTTA